MLNTILKKTINGLKYNLFEIILVVSIFFIICYGIFRYFKNDEGTWTKKEYYDLLPLASIDKKTTKPVKKENKDSKGETICREVLVNILNKPFDKERPDFLRNEVTGGTHNLELDCYNDGLKLAVEYQGRQHYEYVKFFHKNNEHFLNQKYRDDMKRRICKENKINLIEVPYTVPFDRIESFIREKLKELNYI